MPQDQVQGQKPWEKYKAPSVPVTQITKPTTGPWQKYSSTTQTKPSVQAQPQPISQPQPQDRPPSSTSNPQPPYLGGYAGFTPGHMASSAGQGIKNVVMGTTGSWEKGHEGEGGPIEIIGNIEKHLPEMGEQANEIRRQAQEAFKRGGPSGIVEGYTKGTFSLIPMLGPWLNDKYNQAMSGDVGGSAAETATTVGLAKTIDAINEKGPNVAKDVRNSFPKHVIVAVSNQALDHVKNGQVGDLAVEGSRDSSRIGQAIQATKDRIAAKYRSLDATDKAKDPNGFVPARVALTTVDKAIADKGAQVLFDKRMMPSVAKIRALVEGYKGNLTFDNIKQMRSFIGDYYAKASGVEKSVLGDLYSSYSQVLKSRAAQLGQLREYVEANTDTENLKKHQEGLIKDLKSKNTGLQYFNEITKESNKGRLDDLERDMHLPAGFFADTVKDYKPLHRLSALTEGSSTTGLKGSRISAFMRHPVGTTVGIGAGGGIGAGAGLLMGGHSLVGSIMGMTAAAMKVDDFLNRYDAAQRIREMGGPDNVTGRRVQPPQRPASGASLSNITGPSRGPGGGGSSTPGPPAMPSGLPPSRSPSPSGGPSSLSPALAKLLPESDIKIESGAGIRYAVDKNGIRVSIPTNVPDSQIIEYARGEIKKQADMQAAFKAEKAAPDAASKVMPEVKKVPEGERGREPSKRTGMTKDTPEARRAKARERIASRREEGTRTQIKSSLEDQARQVAGKMDFQGRSIPELEEGLQELFGENGKRFLKQFQALGKQQKWSEDVYRGYLEDTIDRRAKELAQRPNIPGLGTETKIE